MEEYYRKDPATSDTSFLLKVVQPGLAGLMDGSVSTLAPIFAAAFATNNSHTTFLIGLSAAIGAGISMAFAEALSDNGAMTGRGHPIMRGAIIGVMTLFGGIFHTLPFLIPSIHAALYLAFIVVGIELMAIAYIRHHFFNMSFWLSIVQVVFGGGLVVAAGLLIGTS
ncbi:MAG TPA: VIT1/CCC1 transporter family protein [Candidatus Paceibacterota bacterium]|nr:VIT1/CCC1 transporter family protein [Candidatus Paceibacterota bacterium]